MRSSTLISLVCGIVVVLFSSFSRASIINCPPKSLQEQANPALRQICYAIEQAVDDIVPQPQTQYSGRFVRRGDNIKREDIDHIILRFGRNFADNNQ